MESATAAHNTTTHPPAVDRWRDFTDEEITILYSALVDSATREDASHEWYMRCNRLSQELLRRSQGRARDRKC